VALVRNVSYELTGYANWQVCRRSVTLHLILRGRYIFVMTYGRHKDAEKIVVSRRIKGMGRNGVVKTISCVLQ